MPLSSAYYDELKTKAEEAANAKKAAYDAALQLATTVQFDELGNIKGYGSTGMGAEDVKFLEQKRLGAGAAESRGMLRSGQYARDLANQLAEYKSRVTGLRAETAAKKTGVESDLATQLAEYKATYDTGDNLEEKKDESAKPQDIKQEKPATAKPKAPSITKPPSFTAAKPTKYPSSAAGARMFEEATKSVKKPTTVKPAVPTARGGGAKIR